MRCLLLAVLTGLALALPGTAQAGTHRTSAPPPPEPNPPSLTVIERGNAEPTLAGLPQTAADSIPPIIATPPRYRQLREAEAECLSVRFSLTANMLDKERAQMAAAHPPPGSQLCGSPHDRAWDLRQRILFYAALDDRNRSAGQALQLYFKAAELETQIDLLQLTRDDIAGAIKKGDELAKKGFHLPTDPGTLRRQMLDTEADLTRAQAGLIDVNGRLKGLIGACDLTADDWLWPAIEVRVSFENVDPEMAIRVALSKRPELLLLREMNGGLDNQTLPVVREYLHGVSGLMGAAGGPTKHVVATLIALKSVFKGGDGEKESRQAQIAQLLADRERTVAEEVRRSVIELHAKSRLVAISRDRLLSAAEHHKDALEKAARAGGSYLEVLSADLDWLKARNQLSVDVMEWHKARAKVREAQGVFVWECCAEGQPR
jgi:hypothetical protein